MRITFKKSYPLFLSLLFLWVTFFTIYTISYYRNDLHSVYSLDDAYIHMAMAKNLAEYGVWGVTKYEFASSSSSIAWTAIIAGIYYLAGLNEFVPMLLNLLFATLTIITSFYILKKFDIESLSALLVLIAVIILTPLPPLMYTGMEHVMHIWFSLLFMYFVMIELSEVHTNHINYILVLMISFMLPSARYEGVILIIAAVFLFLLNKKWLKASLILIVSLMPIAVFGVISTSYGWSVFPNSMTLRWNYPEILSLSGFILFLEVFAVYMFANIEVVIFSFVLLGAAAAVFIRYRKELDKVLKHWLTIIIVLYMANFVLFAAYSRSGFSFRYQTFLAALGVFFGLIIFIKYVSPIIWSKTPVISTTILLLIGIPLIYFSIGRITHIIKTPQSSANIYEQQYQMSRFINQFYEGKNLALNDIGASNYFNDIHCIDLAGLSSLEVSKLKGMGIFTPENISQLCKRKNAEIAILYDSWFVFGGKSVIPPEWVKEGTWTISDNIVCGDTTVSFYSIDEKVQGRLAENLRKFSPLLPETVKQNGNYLK